MVRPLKKKILAKQWKLVKLTVAESKGTITIKMDLDQGGLRSRCREACISPPRPAELSPDPRTKQAWEESWCTVVISSEMQEAAQACRQLRVGTCLFPQTATPSLLMALPVGLRARNFLVNFGQFLIARSRELEHASVSSTRNPVLFTL